MTKGWFLPPMTGLLLPLFWIIVFVCPPLSPVRNGMLLLLIRPLLPLRRGTPPLIGKTPPLALEKGRPLISVLVVIPLTTLAEGFDPPRISCMKKDNAAGFGWAATGAAATGATSTGAASGVSASGRGGSASASVGVVAVAVAGNWPLGKVFVGGETGIIAGVSSASGVSGMSTGDCGLTSSRSRAELAEPRVMASRKRWMMMVLERREEGVVAI